jgi:ubiquinone/menaquinone biosynthesis C-methylase UbiE
VKVSSRSSLEIERVPSRLSVAEAYRLWSRTYDLEPNPLLALEFRMLSHRLENVAGRVFLDVACGTGRWMADAALRGARTIGLDLCHEMLLVAAGKPLLADHLVQADAGGLPLRDQAADVVMCSFCLGYAESPDQILAELCRVARHGGSVLVSDFHPDAHQAGWRRSFRNGSESFEIKCYRHTPAQLIAAGRKAGMRLSRVLEPHLGEPERHILQRAGKEHLLEQLSAVPAVLIIEWERN